MSLQEQQVDHAKLTPLSPEVISNQATINIGTACPGQRMPFPSQWATACFLWPLFEETLENFRAFLSLLKPAFLLPKTTLRLGRFDDVCVWFFVSIGRTSNTPIDLPFYIHPFHDSLNFTKYTTQYNKKNSISAERQSASKLIQEKGHVIGFMYFFLGFCLRIL